VTTTWLVRERIHHGHYRNLREVTIEPTTTGVRQLLGGSPYNASAAKKHDVVGRLLDELDLNGEAEHGWARYEVVEINVPLDDRLSAVADRVNEFTDTFGWLDQNSETAMAEVCRAGIGLGRAVSELIAIMRGEARKA